MVKSLSLRHRDPSFKIRARDVEHKNPRPRRKKIHESKNENPRLSTKVSEISRSDENLLRPRSFKRAFATPNADRSQLYMQT